MGSIKGTFCPKMSTIKDGNGRHIVDAEEIKRWKEYKEELYKGELNEPDYYNGVVSHLKPDILEREVKWALGSTAVNKASGCDGIPELFKTLKMMPSRCCIRYVSKSGRPSGGHRTENVNPHPSFQEG